uniref:Signal recognition particle 14 kDa protein n=1 Tax=Panagrellus redivivus TaxID=6233 RepID=A0A7E4VFY5_PANRE
MTLLDNDKFLSELGKLFQRPKLGGSQSVSITMKPYNGQTKPTPKNPKPGYVAPDEHLCLFRATSGSEKISTVVQAKEVNKFHAAYSQVLRSNTDNLKKREKPKKKPAAGGNAPATTTVN